MNIIDFKSKDDKKKQDAIKKIGEANELEKQKPANFLKAWKQGIKLAGESYFTIKDDLEKATDKNQLCPDYEKINKSLLSIGTNQATFLAVLYSFYNGHDGQQLLEQLNRPNISDIAAYLEKEQLDVVLALMANYQGW